MKMLVFGGTGDSTFGETRNGGLEFCNGGSGQPIEWLIESESACEAVLVVGQWAPGSSCGWLLGVAPSSPCGYGPIPSWPYTLRSPFPGEPNSSPVLQL